MRAVLAKEEIEAPDKDAPSVAAAARQAATFTEAGWVFNGFLLHARGCAVVRRRTSKRGSARAMSDTPCRRCEAPSHRVGRGLPARRGCFTKRRLGLEAARRKGSKSFARTLAVVFLRARCLALDISLGILENRDGGAEI